MPRIVVNEDGRIIGIYTYSNDKDTRKYNYEQLKNQVVSTESEEQQKLDLQQLLDNAVITEISKIDKNLDFTTNDLGVISKISKLEEVEKDANF